MSNSSFRLPYQSVELMKRKVFRELFSVSQQENRSTMTKLFRSQVGETEQLTPKPQRSFSARQCLGANRSPHQTLHTKNHRREPLLPAEPEREKPAMIVPRSQNGMSKISKEKLSFFLIGPLNKDLIVLFAIFFLD